jgi:hypothetical protein
MHVNEAHNLRGVIVIGSARRIRPLGIRGQILREYPQDDTLVLTATGLDVRELI